MTEDGQRKQECLGLETLAAFIDARLPTDARAQAAAHLAECAACYETFVETARTMKDVEMVLGAEPSLAAKGTAMAAPRPQPVLRRYLAAAAAIAALVVLGVLAGRQWRTDHSDAENATAELIAAASRPTVARLSAPFPWSPPPSALRGTATERVTPQATIAAARIEQALERERSVANLRAFATAQFVLGRPEAAVSALEEATGRSSGSAELWNDLAAGYFALAAFPDRAIYLPQGLEATHRALAIRDSDAAAWFNRALILERLSMHDQAIAAWKKFLTLEPNSGWANEAREHLVALEKRSGAARPQDAQPLRDQLFDDVLQRWAAFELAGDSARAEGVLSEARRIVSALGSISADQLAADTVGLVDRSRGVHRRQAAAGHAAYAAGRARYRADDFEAAGPLFERAAAALSAVDSPAARLARLHGAILQYRHRQYVEALASLHALRGTVTGDRYPGLVGRISWVEGLVLEVSGRARDATPRYRESVQCLDLASEPANAAFVQGLLASQFDRLGNPARAWQTWAEALAGTGREGPLLTAAISATQFGWYRTALDLETAAADAARAANRPSTLADSLRWQAVTMTRLGLNDRSRQALADARQLADGRTGATWDRIRAEIDTAQALSKGPGPSGERIEAATRALSYFRNSGASSRLPQILLARADAKRESADGSGAYADLEEGIALLIHLREQVAAGIDQITFTDTVRRLVDAFVEVEDSRGRAREAFSTVEETRARDVLNGPAALTLDELEQLLPERTVLAEFIVGDTRTLAWIVQRGHSTVGRVDVGQAELHQLADAAGPPRFDSAAGRELRRRVIAPLLGALPEGSLLVLVLDGPLHNVNFAMLPGARTEYFVEEHALVMAPSARAWLSSSARLSESMEGPPQAFVAGNPRIDGDRFGMLPALPFAEEEARQVAALYGTNMVTGTDVTPAALMAALDSRQVVHFAGHAVINDVRPEQSALVVWDPGGPGLSADAIRSHPCRRCRLIVLSSCRSAAGLMTRSEGPIGLARAFLAAGAPSVIASRWSVADRASRELLVRFHREYLRSGDPAVALQRAQVAMIHSTDASFRQPGSWAAFAPFGGAPHNTAADPLK